MPEIDELVTTSLRGQAAKIDTTRRFAEEARRRASRVRTARRVTAAVACVVAAAIAVPTGLHLAERGVVGTTDVEPADPGTSDPNGVSRTTIDVNELPMRTAPKVPWYADGKIHDGGREVPIGAVDEKASVWFAPTAAGYVVNISCCVEEDAAKSAHKLIGIDGTVKRNFPLRSPIPIVSADGRTLAWTEDPVNTSPSSELVTADAVTGEELKRVRLPKVGGEAVHPMAFAGPLVLFSTSFSDDNTTGVWNPETGELSTLDDLRGSQGDGPRAATATIADGERQMSCEGIVDPTRDERWLWLNCEEVGEMAISPTGRYAVGTDGITAVIVDLAAEHVVLEVDGPDNITQLAWEAGDTVILATLRGGRTVSTTWEALVRCSVNGDCGLATELRHPGKEGQVTYLLPDHVR